MGLDIDEWIYGAAVKFFKRKKKKAFDDLTHKVELKDIRPRLTILARALCGEAIEIYPAEEEGGYKDNIFFLPSSFAEFSTIEENTSFYLYRTLYLFQQRELRLNWKEKSIELALSREKATESSTEVLKHLAIDFPELISLHDRLKEQFLQREFLEEVASYWLYGKWMSNDLLPNKFDNALENFDENEKAKEVNDIKTVMDAPAIEEVESLTVDKKQQEDYVLLHNFEKVETAEETGGVWRDFDGQDELKEHQSALEELKMNQTVRVDNAVHSIFRAEFVENTTVLESSEKDYEGFHYKYDEWDYSNRSYKKDFCSVYPASPFQSNPSYYQKTIKEHATILMGLRKMITSLNNKMKWQKRQKQGEEFDLDALLDRNIDILAGKSPDENIFYTKRKTEKDISILLLLDISLSSDGYALNNRIIDVEKDVSILFGEILNEFNIDFAIDCFYSKTRNYASYISLKEFDEPWSTGKDKIGGIEPIGYTRIGTALRHAGARISARDTSKKWVILISDGKPNDYDKYEGKYGVQDVKQALRELNEKNVQSYALAIEAQAKYYLPQMFGKNHYQILSSPKNLIDSLVHLFVKIQHG
ncbi:MAG TPA: VWA domain-containing protein [Chitinophagales bacterium]|nr:VWA domain-containing protein [Chitinophagales bacterium]